MALPGSGPISFAQIATELGRTGTSVSLNQSDVAALAGKTTSSSIILPNDFWGKSASDYTPNAVNWTNMSGDAQFGLLSNDQTINGISSSIVVRPTISNFSQSGTLSSGSIKIELDGGTTSVNIWTYNGGITNNTITIPNGSVVRFYIILGAATSTAVSLNCTITVVNNSDGNATLDTFTIAATAPGSGGF